MNFENRLKRSLISRFLYWHLPEDASNLIGSIGTTQGHEMMTIVREFMMRSEQTSKSGNPLTWHKGHVYRTLGTTHGLGRIKD
jgi:hypothetical protein